MPSRQHNTAVFSRAHNPFISLELKMIRKLFSIISLSLLLSHPYTHPMEITNQDECQIMCQTVLSGMAITVTASTVFVAQKLNDYFKKQNQLTNDYFKKQNQLQIENQKQQNAFIKNIEKSEYILNPTDIVKQGPAFLKQLAKELPAYLLPYIQIPTSVEIYDAVLKSASEDIHDLILENAPENKPAPEGNNFVIFHGSSGIGKTKTADAIAHKLNRIILFLKGSVIATTYQNSGAQNITNLLSPLLNSPHDWVVIIDEIDILVAGSNKKEPNEQDLKTASALWQSIDELCKCKNILVIGTCNNPSLLSPPLTFRAQGNFYHFYELSPEDKFKMFFNDLAKKSSCAISPLCYEDSFASIVKGKLKPFPNRTIAQMIERLVSRIRIKKFNEITQAIILSFLITTEKNSRSTQPIDSENERLHKESMALSRELAQQSQNHARLLHEESKILQEKNASDALKQTKELHDKNHKFNMERMLLDAKRELFMFDQRGAQREEDMAMHKESLQIQRETANRQTSWFK